MAPNVKNVNKAKGKCSSLTNGTKDVCVFCNSDEEDDVKYGKMTKKENIMCHYFCLLLASGLSQNGNNENDGIFGFLVSDINKEIKRGLRLKCSYCRKKGATIGCEVRKCSTKFHLPCGVKHSHPPMHIFKNDYKTFCHEHRPKQNITLNITDEVCAVCSEDRDVHGNALYHVLHTPCCKRWIHRICVQRQALNAGRHFFKCPFCNDKEKFKKEMVNFGIYIPDQDASWEQNNAYANLLERHSRCDAHECLCPDGRNYNGEERGPLKWKILICDSCASNGIHVQCGRFSKNVTNWECNTCKGIDTKVDKKRTRVSETQTPNHRKEKGESSSSTSSISDMILLHRHKIKDTNGQNRKRMRSDGHGDRNRDPLVIDLSDDEGHDFIESNNITQLIDITADSSPDDSDIECLS